MASELNVGGILLSDGSNDVELQMGNSSYGIEFDYSAGDFKFKTNGTTKMTLANLGLATFSNGIAFQSETTSPGGTSSESFTLSQYETGLWTPTLLGETGNPTQNYVYQIGQYEKVGRTVFVSGSVKMDTTGISEGRGRMRKGGLQINVSDDANYFTALSIGWSGSFGTTKGAPSGGYFEKNTAFVDLSVYDNDAGNVSGTSLADASDVQNSSRIWFSGFYKTKEL